ncbi:MAG: hypothetical protein IIB42_06615 [Candidatus Marinimicrobia bacterium]|nr:hypothetical protein [Candidatus Neomarinimicrobiota bacterium]
MAIEFHPDVVSAKLQQIASTRKAKSPQSNSPDAKAALAATGQFALMEFYNLHGLMQPSKGGSGTLLDAFLETKKVIQEQVTLLIGTNVTATPKLGAAETAAPEGIPEFLNRGNTAQRIFSIALLGYQEGGDRKAFADKAMTMVIQAYNETGAVPLALDTQQAVLDALEQFKGGAALSEISFE